MSNVETVARWAAVPTPEPAEFRMPPHNVEAEQALLGAILVNNDAYDRVSDFLRPEHFAEEIHRRIFEVTSSLVKAGKIATPDHAEDLSGRPRPRRHHGAALPRPPRRRGHHDHQRGRLRPHDLRPFCEAEPDHDRGGDRQRRLRRAGGPFPARTDRGGRTPALRRRRIGPRRGRLPNLLDGADHRHRRRRQGLRAGRQAFSGISTGMVDLDKSLGGLQKSDLLVLAGRPAMGKTSLATNIAFNIAKAYRSETRPDGTLETVNGGIVGFFSLEMSAEQLATRIIAEQSGVAVLQDPPRRRHRRGFPPGDRGGAADAALPVLHRPDGRHLHRPAHGAGAPLEAPARARPARHRLPAAPVRLEVRRAGQPRAGADGDHHRPQGAWPRSWPCRSSPCPSSVAPSREPRRQETPVVGSARIGLDRAGRRRGDVRVSRRILSPDARSRARSAPKSSHPVAVARWKAPTPRRRSSSASSVTGQPGRCRCTSKPSVTRFSDLVQASTTFRSRCERRTPALLRQGRRRP